MLEYGVRACLHSISLSVINSPRSYQPLTSHVTHSRRSYHSLTPLTSLGRLPCSLPHVTHSHRSPRRLLTSLTPPSQQSLASLASVSRSPHTHLGHLEFDSPHSITSLMSLTRTVTHSPRSRHCPHSPH
eukprot:GHVN01092182.1.p1 GENE.GHVN01092182.1~~GHVN01092182.1.p1  ORF type:complete len:129 (+),score=59.40 GHVN01092182.1:210-596(+)